MTARKCSTLLASPPHSASTTSFPGRSPPRRQDRLNVPRGTGRLPTLLPTGTALSCPWRLGSKVERRSALAWSVAHARSRKKMIRMTGSGVLGQEAGAVEAGAGVGAATAGEAVAVERALVAIGKLTARRRTGAEAGMGRSASTSRTRRRPEMPADATRSDSGFRTTTCRVLRERRTRSKSGVLRRSRTGTAVRTTRGTATTATTPPGDRAIVEDTLDDVAYSRVLYRFHIVSVTELILPGVVLYVDIDVCTVFSKDCVRVVHCPSNAP